MYFLHRPDIDKYVTVHREDEELFYDIRDNDRFSYKDKNTGEFVDKECKFVLIKDNESIKQILEDKYSSRSRTAEYTEGLPSATVISGGLFPYNINYKDYGSKFNILKWMNNISVEDYNAQNLTNRLSLDSGNFIHKILEIALLDDCRDYTRAKGLANYIELACSDKEILKDLKNFNDRKQYFVDMASESLNKFFKNDIAKIHPIFSEIFLNTGMLQGAIDLVNYENGNLYVSDYKTSKKSMARTQVDGKGYLRQLYIYSRMLLSENIITKKEYDNIKFKVHFWNWNSKNYSAYEFTKEEVDRSKLYVNFIYSWYWSIKTGEHKELEI